ncbi:MAG: hypothetical protein OXC98_07160 [bacterium]|nr:hypothetical protein [Acidimicrobiia bacterium]MCY4650131.1 hypothetical protein [bacterium]
MRRLTTHWYPGWVLVVLSAMVLAVLSPHLLFVDNTPSGGDMGAHVLGPAAMRDILLPSGRLLGWSNAWFAGFPLFYFYFPLPSLVIVFLDLFLPYGVAFKLVTVGGLLLLPPAVYFLSRALGFQRLIALVTAAGGTFYALMESFTIYGGNVASTLAGEFTYAWSFSLGFIYLGLLVRVMDGESRLLPRTVVIFCITVLCHLLTTLLLVLGTLAFLTIRRGRRPLVVISAWAFALTGFWSVPFLANLGYSSDLAWSPLTKWREFFPIEVWLLLPLAVVGLVWTLRRARRLRQTWKVVPLLITTLAPVIYFPLPIRLTRQFPDLFLDDRWKLYNGRLLPYWYFGVVFFAMVAVGVAVMVTARRLPRSATPVAAAVTTGASVAVVVAILIPAADSRGRWPIVAGAVLLGIATAATLYRRRQAIAVKQLMAAVLALVVGAGSLAGVSYLAGWSRWNYSGYEAKAGWTEYRDMNTLVARLEPGRVLWENNRDIDQYGTPMAPMLIPYWSGWSHPSMEGLFFESSMSMPFIFITISEMSKQGSNPVPGLRYHNLVMHRGLRHLDMFGVRYYISFTPEATEEAAKYPELREVGVAGPFHIHEAPPTQLVEIARYQPSVYVESPDGEPDFFNFSLAWFETVNNADLWVVADAPPEYGWPTVSHPSLLRPVFLPQQNGSVSNIVVEDHRISFETEAIGVPHLVKVSYFPNWNATGAEGPYLAAPSLMMVVPTDSQVTLEFQNTWAEWLGWSLTVLGLCILSIPRARRWLTLWATAPAPGKKGVTP